jgi:hypothetical protein
MVIFREVTKDQKPHKTNIDGKLISNNFISAGFSLFRGGIREIMDTTATAYSTVR